MAGWGFDSGKLQADGNKGDMYVVLQVVLIKYELLCMFFD